MVLYSSQVHGLSCSYTVIHPAGSYLLNRWSPYNCKIIHCLPGFWFYKDGSLVDSSENKSSKVREESQAVKHKKQFATQQKVKLRMFKEGNKQYEFLQAL